ncbi:MAG: Ig-like domain-containing protein, partial [Bacteroidota bacterium]
IVAIPSVETLRALQIGDSSAQCEGIVHSDGGSTVAERGFVYDTLPNPPFIRWNSTAGWGIGSFTDTISGLYPSTPYYFRAYAQNAVGTAYGSVQVLTLCWNPRITSGTDILCLDTSGTFLALPMGGIWRSSNPSIAQIDSITGLVMGIAAGTATMTYTIAGSGGCPAATASRTVTVTPPPSAGTLSGNQNLCVGSTDTYTSTVTGGSWSSSNPSVATVNTTMGLVTAVSVGTANILYTVAGSGGCANSTTSRSVTVCVALPSLTTTAATSISSIGAATGGVVTSGGGAQVSARGVVYGTSANPTLSNPFTVDGNGIGSFISVLTGLTPVTAYRVRAYATNSAGTAYGNEILFSTSIGLPVLVTSNMSLITHNSAQSGGTISSDGGASIAQRGV